MKISVTKKEAYHFTEDFVLKVFQHTDYSGGVVEKDLVREIREKQYYIPQLDLVVKEDGVIIGHCMLSKFPIDLRGVTNTPAFSGG